MLPPQEEQASYTNGSATSSYSDRNGGSDRGRTGGALVPMGYETAEVPAMSWSAPPMQRPVALTAPPSALGLLSALRRRWFLATALGLTVAAALAAIPYFLMPAKREVACFLQVYVNQPGIMVKERAGPEEFATYKRSQAQMITNQYVLNVALSDNASAISNLPILRAAVSGDPTDQVNFLAKNVEATFPGDATMMRISMWGDDTKQLEQIVDAVAAAYLREVVSKEKLMKQSRYTTLEDMLRRYRSQITSMQQKIADLAEQTGSPDSEVVKRKILQMDREMATARDEVVMAERRANELAMQAALLQTRLDQAQKEDPIVTDAMVDNYLRSTPEFAAVHQQLMQIRHDYETRRANIKPGQKESTPLANLRTKYEKLQADLAQQRDKARGDLLVATKKERIMQLSSELAATKAEGELRLQQVKRAKEQAEKLGTAFQSVSKQSFELSQKNAELYQLQDVTTKIATEYEQLKIELMAPDRVELLDKARLQGNNSVTRYGIIGFCGMLGLLGTMFGVALLEFGARRIGDTSQVTEGLGLKVIGVLPHLSSRGFSKMLGRGNSLRGMLAESIDGIRSSLLHGERNDSLRVILTTSALGHEGKTTVATQLAASLARAGRRTLLIDGDLRNPGAHRLLDQPLDPGLSEVLRGEVELDDVIRPTRAAGLWLIPAGKVCRECVHALAKDSMRTLFAKLRRDFDFIIVDAAPVLSTADTLSLGQHADGVVLSVLRTVSRASKVYEACDRLESVGIPVLGAVVNGVDTPLLRRLPGEVGAKPEAAKKAKAPVAKKKDAKKAKA